MSTKVKLATNIDKDIMEQFKNKCLDNGVKKYNEVIEGLMSAYINEQVKIEVKTLYKISLKDITAN